MTLIYILLTLVAVFSLISMLTLLQLKNRATSTTTFTDERYFELKFKLQFISSIGVIIISVFGYIGYENYNSLLIKTDEVTNKLAKVNNQIDDYDKKFEALNLYSKDIEKIMGVSKSDLKSLNTTIANIRDKNVLDKNFYFIDDLVLPSSNEKKFYFKDLITSYGDRLPIFNKPPTILIAPSTGGNFFINKITTDYVELGVGSSTGVGDNDPFPFTLIVSKRE